MIYLLDLNYTLVENSPKRGTPPIRPFIRQIEQEEYRQWLVDLLRPHRVILITARPNRYQEVTLARIAEKTGWSPMDAYFAEISSRPHQIKEHLLKSKRLINPIFPGSVKAVMMRGWKMETEPGTAIGAAGRRRNFWKTTTEVGCGSETGASSVA